MTLTGLIFQYSYLQVLDLLTTIAFLMVGVREGNPLVRLILDVAPSPLAGLVAVKAVALGLGFYCLWVGKSRLLAKINVLFALVVAWNLIALIIGAARLSRAI